jgi:hypothetical protein
MPPGSPGGIFRLLPVPPPGSAGAGLAARGAGGLAVWRPAVVLVIVSSGGGPAGFRLLAGFALRLFVAGWVRLAAFRLLAGFARR